MVPVTGLVASWLNWAAFCGCVLIGAYVIAVAVLIWTWWEDRKDQEEEEEKKEILEAIARRADRWPFP